MEDSKIRELVKEYSLKHIAMIMDGNGRWAKERGLKRTDGHKVGFDRIVEISEACVDFGIEVISLYAFSTENWKRPKLEVTTIFDLLNKFMDNYLSKLNKNNVKIQVMGDISKLDILSQKTLKYAINKTKNNTGLIINIGINYGFKSELSRAIKNIISDYNDGNVVKDDIDENFVSKYLYTNGLPEPDLLIRTAGDQRLSNFMLYQLAYAEIYFLSTYWPEFNKEELKKAILEFCKRDRRFGGIKEN